MRIRTKLTFSSIALSIIPLVFASIVLGWIAIENATTTLQESARKQLESSRDTKKIQIEDYFRTIQGQVLTFANDRMVIDAMTEMREAFRGISDDYVRSVSVDELKQYYEKEFNRVYRESNGGRSQNIGALLNDLDDEAIYWQLEYCLLYTSPSPRDA